MRFFVWLFPLSFFAFQFILRLWPGLMSQQIMEQFSIDASHFGVLAAFYYYGYAGMQIPVAALLDRFGARYVVSALAIICGLATLLFIHTDNFYVALLARFLIGAGSAGGFLGVSKVVSEWFPKNKYARMIGFSFTFGLTGAIYGGKPVSFLIEEFSWQNVALTLALTSVFIGIGTYIALRSKGSEISAPAEFKLSSFKSLLSSPVMWCLAISNLLMVGSLEGFADVWGVSYLMLAFDLNKGDAAFAISFIFFGMLVGGPLLALLSKRFGNYFVISACGLGMALCFVFLLNAFSYNWWLLAGVFFLLGILCCYQVLVFAAGSELVSLKHLGIAVAFLNCVNMLGGSFFHTLIGAIMDMLWNGAFGSDGLREYDITIYNYALSSIPVCAFIGAIMVYIIQRHIGKKLSISRRAEDELLKTCES